MDAVPSPSASVIDRLVHHLMVAQKVNMLDTTKCSTTARRVYNYLRGADDAGTGPLGNRDPREHIASWLRPANAEFGQAFEFLGASRPEGGRRIQELEKVRDVLTSRPPDRYATRIEGGTRSVPSPV